MVTFTEQEVVAVFKRQPDPCFNLIEETFPFKEENDTVKVTIASTTMITFLAGCSCRMQYRMVASQDFSLDAISHYMASDDFVMPTTGEFAFLLPLLRSKDVMTDPLLVLALLSFSKTLVVMARDFFLNEFIHLAADKTLSES